MFYVKMSKDKFPYNTLKFLFYCLIKNDEPIKKELIKDKVTSNSSEGNDGGETK